jgi:hypothetical protein
VNIARLASIDKLDIHIYKLKRSIKFIVGNEFLSRSYAKVRIIVVILDTFNQKSFTK